jgi:protein-S-isoprenylcysteine O-methyltransferase Ste14
LADAKRKSIPHCTRRRDRSHDGRYRLPPSPGCQIRREDSHREEGYVFATVLRLAGLVLWISTFGYLIFPAYFQWASMPIPLWLRWTGVVTGAFCSLLMYWTLRSLGQNLTDTVVTRAEAKLVTHGPYRWVRNPFYLTAALLMASVTLLTANWPIGVRSVAVLAQLAVRTPRAEEMLIERFDQEYRDYMPAEPKSGEEVLFPKSG